MAPNAAPRFYAGSSATLGTVTPAANAPACPRCRGALKDVRGVAVCLSCGGAFVPAEAVDTVRRAFDEHAQSMALLASQQASRRVDDDAVARCPSCARSMSRFRVGPVEVDTCFDHGSWYDRGELRAVKAALEAGAPTAEVDVGGDDDHGSRDDDDNASATTSGLELARDPVPVPPAPPLYTGSFIDDGARRAIAKLVKSEQREAQDRRRRRRRRRGSALSILEGALDILR